MTDHAPATDTRAATPSFRHDVLHLALPVTAQAVIMSLLMLTDQIMVGQLGDVAIASVGIVSKITAILTVALTGLATATSIFCAQYVGSGQRDQAHRIFGVALQLTTAVTILMVVVSLAWPQALVWPFTSDPAVIAAAAGFLRIIAIGYVPMAGTLLYAALLRSDRVVKLPMYASVVSVVLNVALDYLLIFGSLGAPRWGLHGAAVATTVARCVEFMIIVTVTYRTGAIGAVRSWSDLRTIDNGLRRRFLAVALPLTLNEFLWILGESVYAAVYGRMGTASLAAMGMTFPLQGLSIGLMSGLATAAAVMVGQQLGTNDTPGAIRTASKLLLTSIIGSVLLGGVIAVAAPWYSTLYALTPETRRLSTGCLYVFSVYLFVKVSNMILGSVLNSGGDSKFILIMESSATWLLGVPLALLGAFVWHLSIVWVYALLSVEEIGRLVIGYTRFRSGRWARNLAMEPDTTPIPAVS